MHTLGPDERRQLYDQRFRLVEVIGAGGSGRVWRAVDTDTDEVVALKQVHVYSTSHLARVRREIGALRLLQIPGVVRLVDTGEVAGEPYLVMELLSGHPFPGAPEALGWEEVARRAVALCETLARVHTLGVVHRDLKPANVFVEPDGRVVLLDFGLARGEDLAATVTEHGGIVGTPRYLAPEQLRGAVADVRSDLYAVGVILHEALGGRAGGNDIAALRAAMSGGAAFAPAWPPLPDVPAALADVVQRLLAADPAARPASARVAAEELAAALGERLPPPVTMPFLGRAAELTATLEAARAGRGITVRAAPGHGGTRFLAEVGARLEAEGRRCLWLAPRPGGALAALEAIFGPVGRGPGALSEALALLTDALASGAVLLVDDYADVDLWSRRVIERATAAGAVVCVGELPDAGVVLAPLTEAELRAAFAGPDAFLHLVEDGARLLHERTLGVPSRVVRQVENWVATGRAVWSTPPSPRLTLTRPALDELASRPATVHGLGGSVSLTLPPPLAHVLGWVAMAGHLPLDVLTEVAAVPAWELDLELEELEAAGLVGRRASGEVEALVVPAFLEALSEDRLSAMHRRLAQARADEPEPRMRHWLLAGEPEAALLAADEAASAHESAARFGNAMGVYATAIRAARGAARAEIEAVAVQGYCRAALHVGTRDAVTAAQRYAERLGAAPAPQLMALLRATLAGQRGEWQGAWAEAVAAGPFPDPRLESLRIGVLLRCANVGGVSAVEPVLAMAAAQVETPDGASRLLSWRGLVAYSCGRFADAVALHREALSAAHTRYRKLVSASNLAVALLELGELGEAARRAHDLEAFGRELRLPVFERWGFMSRLEAAYRGGDDTVDVDDDTLAGSAMVGEDVVHANLLRVLAAAAWRRGEPQRAQALAERSCAVALAVHRLDVAAPGAALRVRLGDTEPLPALLELLRADRHHPRLRLQVAALVRAAGHALPTDLAPIPTPPVGDGSRLEVLAIAEALSYLRGTPGFP